jgi:FkbM family methyltransferase
MSVGQFAFKVHRWSRSYISRRLWQLLCTIWPKKVATFMLADGSRLDYPLKSSIGCALFSKSFERSEIAFVRESLKHGDNFLDVGANGGIYTVVAAKQVGPSGHVYAFEPSPRELSLLRHNIAVNNLTNVTIVDRAVSNKSGVSRFAISHDGALSSLAPTNHPGQQIEDWLTVRTVSLDDFVREFSVQKVNFIKMDVEGAEKYVFEGAKGLLSSDHRVTILFEACDLNTSGFGYSVREFLLEISESGLPVFYFDDEGSLTSVSGYDATFGKRIYNFVAFNRPVGFEIKKPGAKMRERSS